MVVSKSRSFWYRGVFLNDFLFLRQRKAPAGGTLPEAKRRISVSPTRSSFVSIARVLSLRVLPQAGGQHAFGFGPLARPRKNMPVTILKHVS